MLLYLIEILHQTTTDIRSLTSFLRCILSKFYIKPQQGSPSRYYFAVVSYRNSTSNHNKIECTAKSAKVVSYRNSTSNHNFLIAHPMAVIVVSYRNSTSNHNKLRDNKDIIGLYLIEILHQTTTMPSATISKNVLYLIEILHQTTTEFSSDTVRRSLYLIEILHQTTTGLCVEGCDESLYLIEILHQTTTSGLILIDKVLLTGCLPL